MHLGHLLPPVLCATGLVLSGCAVDSPASTTDPGTSTLAPTFDKDDRPGHRSHRRQHQRDDGRRPPAATPTTDTTSGSTDGDQSSGQADPPDTAASSTASSTAPATGPDAGSASVRDGHGDVAGVAAPAYADLTGATLTRSGEWFELRVEVAAALPGRQTDGNTMNVASFYDVDGDGRVDYEIWGNLADHGWDTSWRSPDGARFGSDSGVSVDPSGRTLVFAFAASRLGGDRSFRWAVAAEYGSYEQVASGTTASDHAPDGDGSVDFAG